MSAVVKGGLLVIGLGAVGVGGWGVNLVINKEPKAYTLGTKEAANSISEYTANTTVGGMAENKKILVANIEKNKDWFKWVFENNLNPKKSIPSNNLDSEFNAVTQGYSENGGDTATALNKVCDSHYKKGKNDLSINENKKKNIGEYCSIGGNKEIYIPS